jgi:preprotein translocase subunit SecD
MLRGMFYKLLFILGIIAVGVVLVLPTVGEKRLEISLKEGSTPEQLELIKKRFPLDDFEVSQRGKTVLVKGININDAVMNEVRIYSGVKDAKILKHWSEKFFYAKKINLGLDLQGGMQLVLQANYEKIERKSGEKLSESDRRDITEQALEMLRNRIDKFGVSEPSIRSKGSDAIEIQLPGVKDPKKVKKAIGTTGSVEYRLADDIYTKNASQWLKENFKDKELPKDPILQTNLLGMISSEIKLPRNLELLFFFQREEGSKKIYPAYPIALEKKVALAGNDIGKAWVGKDEYGRMAVHFKTTADGASKFAKVTAEENHGKKMAIVIDDKVRSAPQINVQITTGQALIQGDFTLDEVEVISRIIKEGALPVDLTIIEERTVGPSLGLDSIESGIKAIFVGLAGVMIFMVIYYKVGGIFASIGLILNMIFMLALLSRFGFTLTLPGIAGFILTVGMAVDANVIIYERVKEEIRNGKSSRAAVSFGFDRAFWTIFDANLTTLIAAIFLSRVTGPIRGFAVTLIIGIICSMFVALFITRFFFELITLKKDMKKLAI